MNAPERFHEIVLRSIREEIFNAGGREVLFIGRIDPADKQIFDAFVGARGSYEMVPALAPHMERGDVVIHNHPSGVLRPSKPDLSVANSLGQQGIGFWIIDNEATEVYAVSEPVLLEPKRLLSESEAAETLSPKGAFSRLLSSYETRENQIALLRLFVRGLNEDAVVSAEAGTGVGKSFAYLIPAILWTLRNKERIVVATATINLQQQLFEKDIPFVQKALGSQLKVVLVKGRRNYLCPHRLSEEMKDPSDPESLFELQRIADWASTTKAGDVQELTLPPSEGLWGRVCSDADACSGIRCSQKDACFLSKARKEAAGASLLIANHHLLFADLSLRVDGFGFEATAVLPPFHRLIFDEAHNLEKSATSYFSREFSRHFLQKQLNRLYRKRRMLESGLVPSLRGIFTQVLDLGAVPTLIARLASQSDQTDRLLLDALGIESSFRMTKDRLSWWTDVLTPALIGLQDPLLHLIRLCEQLTETWMDQEERPPEVQELKTTCRRLEALSQVLDLFKSWADDFDNVYWFQKGRDPSGGLFVTWIVSPLSVREVFQEAVFQPFRTVLLTSATLTVQGKFTFWGRRLGLDYVEKERRLFGIFPSPFDYAQRVLLGIPTDFPSPESPAFQENLQDYLISLLSTSQGSALVLFTSYDSLRKAYTAVAPQMAKKGISVYRQGDEERSRLLERFKTEISSVLFATDSFWEGVDSPGETLKLLVICRLPFRVPGEPVLAARLEAIERTGQDAFFSYSLPEAVTRFQQGFGRLIRHTSDYGVLVVLDTRVVRKSYGKIFLASIPSTQRAFLSKTELVPQVWKFLSFYQQNDFFRPLSESNKIE